LWQSPFGACLKTGLKGVKKDHPYKVAMRLLDFPMGIEIARYERPFHSDVDQATLPDKPLVIGPANRPSFDE